MCFLHFTVFDDERISLASITAEDGGPVESEIKRLGEFPGGVAEKADLGMKRERTLLVRG